MLNNRLPKKLENLLKGLILISLLSCAFAQGVLDIKIAGPNDDAEELVGESVVGPAGSAYLDSSDLELADDADTTQIIGLRFTGLELDPNTTITRAYIQFTVDEATSDAALLTVYGEASDDAASFSETPHLLSSRPQTTMSIAWSPAPWTEPGQAGEAQQTPDLSELIEEIISRPGWQRGNALVLMLSGEGKRVAEAFDGSSSAAATLHIEYETAQAQAETAEKSDATTDTATGETTETATPEPTTPEETSTETADTTDTTNTTTSETTESTEADTSTEVASPEVADPETVTPQPSTSAEADTLDPAKGRRYALAGEGVTGSLLVTNYGNGTVILTVLVSGQSAGDVYGARLNLGSCTAPGESLFDLEPVRANRGSLSVTSSEVDFATLTESDLNLTLLSSPESDERIACGEVGAN